jgi:molecular chaperone DnaK
MSADTIIGIDLGTTFSAVAYINKHGQPEIIQNIEGDRTTPSAIFFEDDGTPIVGKQAINQALISPERTIRFFKRDMGDPSFRFNVDGQDFTPESLSAIVLKKLKEDAEDRLGHEVKKAVISVPAYFKDTQREATRQAGAIAGLEVLRIINEPTAAALAYGLDREEDQTMLIYDFGGGTFDVTIMKVKNNEFTVLATDGDSRLGGADIDELIVNYLAEDFMGLHGIDLRKNPRTNQDLWDKAEIAKKSLSITNSTKLVVSADGKDARVDIDRSDFEDLIENLVSRTETYLRNVLDNSKLTWDDIDNILLVGGSSRIPLVKETIERVTGKPPVKNTNPDECVALGAAIQSVLLNSEVDNKSSDTEGSPESPPGNVGVQLKSSSGEIVQIKVLDIASHSLGIKVFSAEKDKQINSIIIPQFTKIPCEITKEYSTIEDNQSRVEFDVLQGEDEDPRSPNIDRIGKAGLRKLPPHKAGELAIEVTLKYTADGIIEVVTRESKSGEISRESIMQKSGSLSDEEIEQKKEWLQNVSQV